MVSSFKLVPVFRPDTTSSGERRRYYKLRHRRKSTREMRTAVQLGAPVGATQAQPGALPGAPGGLEGLPLHAVEKEAEPLRVKDFVLMKGSLNPLAAPYVPGDAGTVVAP